MRRRGLRNRRCEGGMRLETRNHREQNCRYLFYDDEARMLMRTLNFSRFGGSRGSFWRLILVFWRPRGALKTTFAAQNPFLGGDCVKEGSLERPQVALCGPKCPQVAPKDAPRAPKRSPKRPPNGGKIVPKRYFI